MKINKKIRYPLAAAIVCILSLLQAFADDSVKLRNTSSHPVAVRANTTDVYDVFTSEPTGDPADEDNPLTVYLPTKNTGDNVTQYFYLRKALIDTSSTNSVTDAVLFPLMLNVGLSEKFLTIAVKNGTGYKVAVASVDENFVNLTNYNYTLEVAPGYLCSAQATNNCSTTSAVQPEMLVYVFLSDTVFSTSEPISDISQYPNGVYFKLKMSNMPPADAAKPVIQKLIVGDTRLILQFSATSKMANGKYVRVFMHDPGSTGDRPIADGAVSGNLHLQTMDFVQSGEFNVNNLLNDNDYTLSVLFINIYGIATKLSPELSGRPLEIAELLKKQSCFFLTAGFGEEHYIIDYFRHFRDSVLANYKIGRASIDIYYDFAPKYALLLYKSDLLRFMVRSMAYGLYFIFNFYKWIFAIGGLLVAIYFFSFRQRKNITV